MPDASVVPRGARSTIGVLVEHPGTEHRVALVPASVTTLVAAGHHVVIEASAGAAATFDDAAYVEAGADVTLRKQVVDRADVIVTIGALASEGLREGQVVIGLLDPANHTALMAEYAVAGVEAISLDGLPRTVSRAQSMDALTSQANVAGYKAAVLAADTFAGFFPMLMTAAGTVRPAKVLVLGAGVAGLQAIGTAKRLGAVVQGYDVRPAAKADIESLGATFVALATMPDAADDDGYARALTAEESAKQQIELAEVIGRTDVVICTAQAHGHAPPELVTADALERMRPGSVLIDIAASEAGGNVHGSEPGRTVTTTSGVVVVGAGDLPSRMPAAASTAYAKNICSVLDLLDTGEGVVIDLDDEIQAGIVVVHDHHVLDRPTPPTQESEEDHHELQPVR